MESVRSSCVKCEEGQGERLGGGFDLPQLSVVSPTSGMSCTVHGYCRDLFFYYTWYFGVTGLN